LARLRSQEPVTGEFASPAGRPTGIHFIGDLPWGAHLCVFYETKQDLLDATVSYFRAGLASNEFCVWAVSDPITVEEAMDALRTAIPDIERNVQSGQIELLCGEDWYLEDDRFDLNRVMGGWAEKLQTALANGFEGMRASGNAFWIETEHQESFSNYEAEVDRALADLKMIALCTYSLQTSRAVDFMNVVQTHRCTVARRNGTWEFLETPELKQTTRGIDAANGAYDPPAKPFAGQDTLTPRESVALIHIVRGASTKEVARALGISPRTVEFHRANIMRKLGARNIADLVRRVLGD
jgi:DNA-binding CsgD family transcriptional regulator